MSFATVLLSVAVLSSYIATPALLLWGWARWASRPKLGVFSILSLLGFLFSTASALWALGGAVEARLHPFAFYDPRLMHTFRIGFLLSLAGMLFGICGIWRKNSLRWHAPLTALGTFLFWAVAALSE